MCKICEKYNWYHVFLFFPSYPFACVCFPGFLLPGPRTPIRTLAPRHTSPCAPILVCWSPCSPSCCWPASQSWALQRTCDTCGRRSRRNRVRQQPGSISSSRSLSVSSLAGLCRPTGGSTWWQASNECFVSAVLPLWGRWKGCSNVYMHHWLFFTVWFLSVSVSFKLLFSKEALFL